MITTAVSAVGHRGGESPIAKIRSTAAYADGRRHQAPVGDLAQDVPELLEGVTGALGDAGRGWRSWPTMIWMAMRRDEPGEHRLRHEVRDPAHSGQTGDEKDDARGQREAPR